MIYEGVGGYGKIKIKENGMTLINIKKLKNVIISVQSCSQVPAEYFMEIFHYKTHRSVAGWVGLENMFGCKLYNQIFSILSPRHHNSSLDMDSFSNLRNASYAISSPAASWRQSSGDKSRQEGNGLI